jgi:glycosyltransferase involved in cell wall biosynthesis
VQKIAGTVCGLGCDVRIIGRWKDDYCNANNVPFETKRFRMLFKKGFLFYKWFNIRLFFYLLISKSDLLVANDLDTLLPNYLVSRLKKIPLVYDSHEYFTGVPELMGRPFVRWVWKVIEKYIFPKLRFVITVSDSIAELYEEEYNVRPLVVRNCSPISERSDSFSHDELAISQDNLLVILQGTGINIDRGGEELIEAVRMTEKVSLLIVGDGDAVESMKMMAKNMGIDERVLFIPPVPRELLFRYTRSADAGLTLDKDTNINYRYSLPNKLFDYIGAGIPVIASDLHEVRKIIAEFNCGIIINSVTPENISYAFMELNSNRLKLNEMKKNSLIASRNLNWEKESEKVKNLYREVLLYC